MIRLFKGFAAAILIIALVGTVLSTALFPSNTQDSPLAIESNSNTLAQQIIGTWQLEEASSPGSPSGIGTRLKLFTGTHWCIIQPNPQSGLIVFQHGGRYELDGDQMKITRDFAGDSTRGMIGGTGAFKIKINGDTMEQRDLGGVFNETWKRVK